MVEFDDGRLDDAEALEGADRLLRPLAEAGARLLAEGKDLPTWHPLLTGSKAAMHGERISVRHIAVKESEVQDWEDHIMNHPNR